MKQSVRRQRAKAVVAEMLVTGITVTPEALINDAAKGRITPEETAKEVQAAIKQEEAPPLVPGVQAERRLVVFGPLRRAKDALDELDAGSVYDLDREYLSDLEPVLRGLGAQLNRLGQWMAAAREKRQSKSQSGSKVLRFGER